MGVLKRIKRNYQMKSILRNLLKLGIKCYHTRVTSNFIKTLKGKKVLMMHASPHNYNMLKQRPHHFLDFWAKHFDAVFYWSLLIDEPVKYKDNIYLVPRTPVHKFNDVDIYFYMSSVSCMYYKQFFKMKEFGYKIIYDYYDELSDSIASTKKSKKSHEKLAEINPQIILATSQRLYDDMKSKIPNKEEIYLIKNGVTVEDFMKPEAEIPEDMKDIIAQNKPIVGFYGLIAPWIDIDLIEECLKNRPEYNFVFIGKQHNNQKYEHLLKYPNFYFLGHKKYEDLYKYSSRFDCAIIPFKEGNIAKATSPNKLFEYMAVGCPTVCTKDLVECYGFEGVYVSKTSQEFIKDIDNAIIEAQDPIIIEKLQKTAMENSWENKADEIYKLMKNI